MPSTPRVARTLAICAIMALALAAPASAASKNGITPLAPKVADPGAGVFLHVCKSGKRDKQGMICKKATILQAKKRKGAWEAKQTFFDFPAFWLNNPGTYYWQAYRIECRSGSSDCKQEGPVVRFKVK
jgi:hypothetical protein